MYFFKCTFGKLMLVVVLFCLFKYALPIICFMFRI